MSRRLMLVLAPVLIGSSNGGPDYGTPGATMPGQSGYNDVPLDAFTAYFRTFAASGANIHPEKNKTP